MMWKWDHLEVIDWSEYVYWMCHVLPFGWAIISRPSEQELQAIHDLTNNDWARGE